VLLFVVVLLGLMVVCLNVFSFDQVVLIFFATVHLGRAFDVSIERRMLELNSLFFILFIICQTDLVPYILITLVLKRELWPAISPNKTIGGALGGLILAVIIGSIFHIVYPFSLPFYSIILISLVISVVGQLGDLVASAMKRHYQIKDFGKLFPGHGGILDRLDSLLFVLIVLSIIQFI